MVVEHAHGLRQRRGPNAKSSLHKAHLAPDAGLQAPGASLSFAQGSHDFESLDRGIGRGDRFETAHRLDQYLELRSEERTSELQSLMRISYAVFCLKKKTRKGYGVNTTSRCKIQTQQSSVSSNHQKSNRHVYSNMQNTKDQG